MIKLPDTIKSLYLCGDVHQNYELIKYYVANRHLKDCCIIGLGDIGLGFNPKYDAQIFPLINKKLSLSGCYWVTLYGNHDSPMSFRDDSCVMENGNTRNWIKVPNYTVVNACGKNILCVCGGVSIDRTWRIANGIGYWPDEQVKYQPKVDEKIDIICSHSAPSFAPPTDKGDSVMMWSRYDPDLLKDLEIERTTLDRVYDDYKDTITHWYYGHFHQSLEAKINNVYFRCCNIGELVAHRDDSYFEDLE